MFREAESRESGLVAINRRTTGIWVFNCVSPRELKRLGNCLNRDLLDWRIFRMTDFGKMERGSWDVDLRINETLQIGAGGNRTYREAKVSIYFLNSP